MDKIILIDNPTIKLLATDGSDETKVILASEPTVIKVETAADLFINLYLDETKLVPVDTSYVKPSVGMAFTDLIDAPSSLVGQKGMVVGVNNSEQGLTFISSSTITEQAEDDCVAYAIIFGS